MLSVLPKCPKCENSTFGIQTIEPIGARFKMIAVCCASCGTVVGVTEYSDVGTLVMRLAAKLNVPLD
jgi:hypothetical protein